MPKKSVPAAPLTFDLPVSLIRAIGRYQRENKIKSTSEVVRLAVNMFDIEGFEPVNDPHRQISVRVPGNTRTLLRRAAKRKDSSIGEILRAALEALTAMKSKVPARSAAKAKKKK